MANEVKDVAKQTSAAVEQPVNNWRRRIRAAGTIAGKSWRRYRASVFQLYLVGAVIIFVVLAFLAKTVAYFTFDVTITHAIQTVNAGWFDALMSLLTWIGFSPASWIISALVIGFLFVSGLKWEALVTLISLIGFSLLGLAIKVVVVRPRPSADLVRVIAQLNDYSFPSGHVLYFTTFFGFLLFLTYTLVKPVWWRTLLLVILSAMIALIGVSRIYEGQHWASDVLAAYLLGSVLLSINILVYRWGKPRYFVNQPVAKETPTQSA